MTQLKFIGLTLFVLLNTFSAFGAETTTSPKFKSGPTGISGSDVKSRTALIQQHLKNAREEKAADQQLSWPSFPRMWMERTSSKTESSSLAIGMTLLAGGGPGVGPFKSPGVSGFKKSSVEFKYTVTTSMILIATAGTATSNDIIKVENDDMFLEQRPGTSLIYPRVSEQRPMVGLCYFEMTLNEDFLKSQGIDFIGGSASSQSGIHEMGKVSRFSTFFQVKDDVAVESYHFESCANRFRKEVEESVIKNFTLLIYQMVHNTCAPPTAGEINPEGESSCQVWMDRFPSRYKKTYTPRCEQDKAGSYRCVLKAKKGNLCPLYSDRKTSVLSEKFDLRSFNMKVTGLDSTVIPCDTAMGEKCELIKAPWMALGVPLVRGESRCR